MQTLYTIIILALYDKLRSKDPCAIKIQKQAKDWVISFTSLKSKCDGYQPDKVTPYMHIMELHMPEVIRKPHAINMALFKDANHPMLYFIFYSKACSSGITICYSLSMF